uniref:SecY-independent transporter protein n=1 Tax=Entransia fimbriata TaxID=130991 RepID=U5YDX6_9VIRI|nr:SecY-independent transporter protein [Entransia fimbriata]AGZ90289.1 SecY-independent transporter protein [Entransia fimbriata]
MSFYFIIKELKCRFFLVFCKFHLYNRYLFFFSDEFFYILSFPIRTTLEASGSLSPGSLNELSGELTLGPLLCTQVGEAFNSLLFYGFFFSCLFCFPLLCYQFWCFWIPSCSTLERREITLYILFSSFVFFQYKALPFFISFRKESFFIYNPGVRFFHIQPTSYSYLSFILKLVVLGGFCSQIPVIYLCTRGIGLYSQPGLHVPRVAHRDGGRDAPRRGTPPRRVARTTCPKISHLFSILASSLLAPPELGTQISLIICLFFIIEFSLMIDLIFGEYNLIGQSVRL